MMILLREPDGAEMVCVYIPENWDGDLEALGYPGWTELEQREEPPPEHADYVDGVGFVVDEQRKARELEVARLSALTRFEFMAEVDAKMQAQEEAHAVTIASLHDEIAKRDVQIAELASGAQVTPLDQVAVTPMDPATILSADKAS